MPLGYTFDPMTDMVPVASTPSPEWTAALESVAPNITTIIPQQQAAGESWYDSLARALPIVAATVQQKEILDIQVQRAKQGLPPLDASQYAAGVNVGLSPETTRLVTYGIVAIVAVLVLTRK